MKIYLLFLLAISCLSISCSEEFNINAPNEDVYVLNCILRYDCTTQYAIISKNLFTSNGGKPSSNCIDQNVKGADVKISYNDTVFVMRDTTIKVIESGKELDVNCYYVNNFTFRPGISINIKASVPGGKTLQSTIHVPEIIWRISSDFPQEYVKTVEIPFSGKSLQTNGVMIKPDYNWSWKINNQAYKNIINIPQLEIYYKKNENGIPIDKQKIIPLSYYTYVDENGFLYYPDIKYSFNNYCWTTLKNVNKAMLEISEDDPDKKKYIINKVVFSVFGTSTELSRYYSIYHVYSNDFTIKLRSADYTNIKGGKGIFGTYYKYSKSLNIDKLYIKSFGYKYDPIK